VHYCIMAGNALLKRTGDAHCLMQPGSCSLSPAPLVITPCMTGCVLQQLLVVSVPSSCVTIVYIVPFIYIRYLHQGAVQQGFDPPGGAAPSPGGAVPAAAF
jgi:hypothetical protein